MKKRKAECVSKTQEVERRAESLLEPIVQSLGFELVDVEYVKEGGTWYLRGYIDKPEGITVNDCEAVSRLFNEKLDADEKLGGLDAYVMEICSPGLDRPLKKPKDFERNKGKLIEIRTYQPVDKKKEFIGILTAYDNETVSIREVDPEEYDDFSEEVSDDPGVEEETDSLEPEDGSIRVFNRKSIALIRQAVIF